CHEPRRQWADGFDELTRGRLRIKLVSRWTKDRFCHAATRPERALHDESGRHEPAAHRSEWHAGRLTGLVSARGQARFRGELRRRRERHLRNEPGRNRNYAPLGTFG